MRLFYWRAQQEKDRQQPNEKEIDEDYLRAAALAEKVAPYRHSRLATMRLSGNPNAQQIPDDITAEELRAAILSDNSLRNFCRRKP